MFHSRQFFDQKIKLIAQTREVLDVGGASGFAKILSPYKDILEKTNYKTLDISPATKPDLVGDIHDIPLPDNALDAVICISVLEHIEQPQKALDEIHRVLKDGGQCLLYAPFLYSYHAREGDYHYKDYFRYSKDGLMYLARRFSNIELVPVMLFFETWLYLLPHPLCRYFAPLGRALDKLFPSRGNQTSGHYAYFVK